MLSDPLVVTVSGIARSMPRSARRMASVSKQTGQSSYGTPDGEFEVFTSSHQLADGSTRVEISLRRTPPDPDSDPFTGSGAILPNSFGFVYTVNSFHYSTATDIPALRAALDAFVTSTIQSRLIGGEL